MTTYSAVAPTNSSSLAVIAATYQMRLGQITGAYSGGFLSIWRIVNSSANSTTPVTPIALRQEAPACAAIAWTGVSFTGGTSAMLYSQVTNSTAAISFQPGFDLVISPGTAILVSGPANSLSSCQIYFEELRLSWST